MKLNVAASSPPLRASCCLLFFRINSSFGHLRAAPQSVLCCRDNQQPMTNTLLSDIGLLVERHPACFRKLWWSLRLFSLIPLFFYCSSSSSEPNCWKSPTAEQNHTPSDGFVLDVTCLSSALCRNLKIVIIKVRTVGAVLGHIYAINNNNNWTSSWGLIPVSSC